METGKVLVLSLVCLSAYGLPSPSSFSDRNSPIIGNTIFAEERFAGEIFEDIDAYSNITFSPRNEVSPYRLPTTTKPVHYDVMWIIDLVRTMPTQSGTVQIQLQATQANVNEIVIHSSELTLSSVQLLQNTNSIPITFEEDATYQFLRVRLDTGFLVFNAETPVIYTLRIEFSAFLRDDMYGIYKTWYRNSATDEVRWMASTQFQATAARWAFPCYDEPSFKATFDITIRRPNTYKSWSCTRLKEINAVENAPTFQDDVYHRTPIMSTYLLALIVSEYDSVSSTNTQGQLMFEVIARPGAISADQGDYALDVGQRLLNKMSEHTYIDFYTQDVNLKMTQAAIPDFGAGAMENWGLLTYREAYLMYDKSETNSYYKQMIATILSHEIAHMWFGNLVTCDWWDVTWLNEGFARYYQYHLTFWVEDMGLETRFIPEQVHTSLLSDSSNNPQPLTYPNRNSNSAVSNMFSTITYNKGAAVIRMTEHLLGSEVHVTGLRTYLKDRSYKTGLPIQLFEHLEKAGKDAGVLNYGPEFSFIEYFKSWTENPGHPVLNVHVNHQTGVMTVSQRRFNINSRYSNIETNYIVPITFATASNPHFHETKPTHILTTQEATINRGTTGDEWVIFNNQQTGFYRVNYDDYTWDLIAIALKGDDMTLIHENNRAQIVNDLFQFARSGLMEYSRALNILSYLEHETDYAPWVAAVTGFNWLRQRLAGDTTAVELALLNNLIAKWASKVMDLLTYYPTEGEAFMHSYLRYQLAPLMCNLGEIACLQAAKTQFEALRTSNTPVPVDSRHWVYCNGLRQGNAEDFNFLWNRFQNFNVYTEKILILQNIGCTKDVASLETFMRAIVSDNYIIRPQDYNTAFSSAVNGNEENTETAFMFIRDNLELVSHGFKGSVATPMSYVTARLRSEERINQFIVWAEANQQFLGSAYSSVVNGARLTRDSIVWAETRREEINDYLVNGADPPTTSTTTITTTEAPEGSTVDPGQSTDEGSTDDPGQSTDNQESTNPGQNTVKPPPITEPVTPVFPTTPSFATKNYVATITIIVAMIVTLVL